MPSGTCQTACIVIAHMRLRQAVIRAIILSSKTANSSSFLLPLLVFLIVPNMI